MAALPVREQDRGKPTLVLDLDGTLVSACDWRRCGDDRGLYDFEVEVHHSERFTERLLVKRRPGLDAFLAAMAEAYEIILFSYSVAPYVNAIMDKVDGQQLVAHRLSYESCPAGSKLVRSPRFGGRDPKRIVWLDDSPGAFVDCPDNGVVVPHFNVTSARADANKDTVLRDLTPLLKSIASSRDVARDLAMWKKAKVSMWRCSIL